MERNWSTIDKKALESMQFVYDYCDMIDCCDGCIFRDEEKEEDRCTLKLFHGSENYHKLWEKRKKEI